MRIVLYSQALHQSRGSTQPHKSGADCSTGGVCLDWAENVLWVPWHCSVRREPNTPPNHKTILLTGLPGYVMVPQVCLTHNRRRPNTSLFVCAQRWLERLYTQVDHSRIGTNTAFCPSSPLCPFLEDTPMIQPSTIMGLL